LKIIWITLLIGLSASSWAENASMVDVSIVKSKEDKWTLTYQTAKPTARLGFIRNPDSSRIERWQPKTPGFELVSIDEQEYLIKTDGTNFTEVSLQLTPTYKHLSKDYAPFSPYSEAGLLIYTGRLFACIDTCNDDVNQWRFSMQVPEDEHMIVNGKVLTGTTSWLDSNNGMNVYVGSQRPIETDNVIAVIDQGLPEKIKLSLDSDIPKLMDFFEQRLGQIEGIKPALFASYANIEGHSSQGGTLPNQVFMHWNVNNLAQKVKDNKFLNDTIWFFAHEVAHLYQTSSHEDIYGDSHESWLHEGHADWLAALALLALYPDTKEYVDDKIERFRAHCAKGLTDFPLTEAADQGRFDLYYTCGLLIHQAIDLTLHKRTNTDTFSLWKAFRQQADNSDKKGMEVFLAEVEKSTSIAFVNKIKKVIERQLEQPRDTLDKLIID